MPRGGWNEKKIDAEACLSLGPIASAAGVSGRSAPGLSTEGLPHHPKPPGYSNGKHSNGQADLQHAKQTKQKPSTWHTEVEKPEKLLYKCFRVVRVCCVTTTFHSCLPIAFWHCSLQPRPTMFYSSLLAVESSHAGSWRSGQSHCELRIAATLLDC